MRDEARRHVALVEGSTPHMSAETRDLLRNRLRIAAILFFVGFFVFLVRWVFIWNEWFAPSIGRCSSRTPRSRSCLGCLRVRLCRHCSYSLTKLRMAELVIFGCPALFFVVKGCRNRRFWRNCRTAGRGSICW